MHRLFEYALLILLAAIATVGEAATVHRVQKGETLTEIAQRYQVSPKDIEAANQLTNANRLRVGQELAIPGAAPVGATTPYTVRRGDNLSDIAKRHNVTVEAIKQANQLSNANRLSVGQVLAIPGAAASVSASSYTIKRGDNLSDIAKRHNVTVEAIRQANSLADPNSLNVGQEIVIPGNVPATFVDYKIRRGDSLSDIAKKHGLTLAQLTAANNIRNANRISVGQTLRIPVTGGAIPTAYRGPLLDSRVANALAAIRSKRNQWQHIVIHHSGTRVGSAKSMDRFHREERRMENGLAYHFVIGNGRGMGDGEVYIGDRWKKQIQGGHLSSYALNQISIGICLVGDFQKNRPSQRQMDQLEALVRALMNETGVPEHRVTSHTLIHPKHTLCPGKHFPMEQLRRNLAR